MAEISKDVRRLESKVNRVALPCSISLAGSDAEPCVRCCVLFAAIPKSAGSQGLRLFGFLDCSLGINERPKKFTSPTGFSLDYIPAS